MGSIYRQKGKGPNWIIKYYRDGRPVVEHTETDNYKKAEKILKKREVAVDDGVPLTPSVGRVRFEEAVTDMTNDFIAKGKTSLDDLARRIRKHLVPVFGGRRLANITGADIQAYVVARLAETYSVRRAVVETLPNGQTRIVKPEVRRPYSKAQVNRELMALSRIYNVAIANGKILRDSKPH